MNASKLLKLKNKLSGDIHRIRTLIEQENVVQNDNKPAFDVLKLYEEYNQTTKELAEVKTRLAVANIPIYGKIFEMAELKGTAQFLKSLDVNQGKFILGRGENKTEITYTPAIDKVFVDNENKKISVRIEELQEYLDEFNHAVQV